MQLTARQLSIVRTVSTYYTLPRTLIQELCVPEDKRDGAVTRKALGILFHHRLINKTQQLVVNPHTSAMGPVYYPSRQGLEHLFVETGDRAWLDKCCACPNWQLLPHWIEGARFHIELDRAVTLQTESRVENYLHEYDVANPRETDPAKHFRLFQELRKEPRMVCAPDAGFELCVGDYRKVYFLEACRGTTGLNAMIASKTPGYAMLADQKAHLKVFPRANVPNFSVLLVTTDEKRRDALRFLMKEKKAAGMNLWLFAAVSDVRKEKLLSEAIWYDVDKGPFPLLKRKEGGS